MGRGRKSAEFHRLQSIAEDLEILSKKPEFVRWRNFVIGKINELRDQVELFTDKYTDEQIRAMLIEIKVYRERFIDLFDEWKQLAKEVASSLKQIDSETDSEDGPDV